MAADAIVSAAYGAAGERCMALSVAVAVATSATTWCRHLLTLPKLSVGREQWEGTDMGPAHHA